MKRLLLIFFSIGLYTSAYSTRPPFRDHNKFYHFLNAEILQYQTTGFSGGFNYSIPSGKRVSGMKGMEPTFQPFFMFGGGINAHIYPFITNKIVAVDANLWFTPKFKIPLTFHTHFIDYFYGGEQSFSFKPNVGYIFRTKKFHPYSSFGNNSKLMVFEISYGYNFSLQNDIPISPHQFCIKFFFLANHLRAKPDLHLK